MPWKGKAIQETSFSAETFRTNGWSMSEVEFLRSFPYTNSLCQSKNPRTSLDSSLKPASSCSLVLYPFSASLFHFLVTWQPWRTPLIKVEGKFLWATVHLLQWRSSPLASSKFLVWFRYAPHQNRLLYHLIDSVSLTTSLLRRASWSPWFSDSKMKITKREWGKKKHRLVLPDNGWVCASTSIFCMKWSVRAKRINLLAWPSCLKANLTS